MKHGKFVIGMAIVVLAAMVFTGCTKNGESATPEAVKDPHPTEAPVLREKPEFTYGLAPGSLVNYRAKIQGDTENLVNLLTMKKTDGEILLHKDWNNSMGETYLKNPKLTWNDQMFEDIDEVISALNDIIALSKEFDFVKAHIAFQHIPFDPQSGSEWMRHNEKRPPGKEIDFIGHIKATISYNGEFTMEGTLPHRRICEPEI
ncbi:MAG: hypothetical protein SCM96_00985 [Acidobacteriota bacterium]|nr:hypothetical protein [Acidobacteriota bacterium]